MDRLEGYYAKLKKSEKQRHIQCVITYRENLKNKLLTITQREQTQRYREQTSGYRWGEGKGEGQYRGRGLRGTNSGYKISCVCSCSVAQLCLTLCNPRDYSPPGSSVYGISQARMLKWVAFPAPGIEPESPVSPASPALAGGIFTTEPPRKPCLFIHPQINSDMSKSVLIALEQEGPF